jgi:hypothetical protein
MGVRAYDGTGAHHNSRTAYRALPNTAVHVNGSKTTQDSAKTKRSERRVPNQATTAYVMTVEDGM